MVSGYYSFSFVSLYMFESISNRFIFKLIKRLTAVVVKAVKAAVQAVQS